MCRAASSIFLRLSAASCHLPCFWKTAAKLSMHAMVHPYVSVVNGKSFWRTYSICCHRPCTVKTDARMWAKCWLHGWFRPHSPWTFFRVSSCNFNVSSCHFSAAVNSSVETKLLAIWPAACMLELRWVS